MPRYYFHISSKDEAIPDHHGVELDGLRDAHRLAMKIIKETMKVVADEPEWGEWLIEVVDARDEALLTVLYPRPRSSRRSWFGRRQRVPTLMEGERRL
jgi:hypothetical protein